MDTTAGTLVKFRMYIDGQWVDSASGQTVESFNPFTGKPWAVVPRGNAEDVDRAVQAARKAFTSGEWPKMTATRRGALLRKLGDLIADKSKVLAEIEVRDNGKLYAEMSEQTAYMAQWYYYYGGLADNMPKYAVVFMVMMLASVGLPGTSGFVGEFLVLVGSFQVSTWFTTLAATGQLVNIADGTTSANVARVDATGALKVWGSGQAELGKVVPGANPHEASTNASWMLTCPARMDLISLPCNARPASNFSSRKYSKPALRLVATTLKFSAII